METQSAALPKQDAVLLTERQRAVVALVAAGLSNGEIAQRLGVTKKTVEFHLTRTYERVGCTSRVELVLAALARGWVRVPARR